MKISKQYTERLREYYYFAMGNRGPDFKMMNSKMPITGKMPKDLPQRAPTGISAREALFTWESTGKLVACREPRLFYRLMAGKAWRDWHISEWIKGCVEGSITIFELIQDKIPSSLIESVRQGRYSLNRAK